jgi:hypothetical protein
MSPQRKPSTGPPKGAPKAKKSTAKASRMPKVGAETVERFDELAETFVARGAKRSQMFGMPVLKAGDKVFAGTFGDAMTFKLGPGDLEDARSRDGVEPFEPMKGRAMKEWVLVPLAQSRRWAELAEWAFAYVS